MKRFLIISISLITLFLLVGATGTQMTREETNALFDTSTPNAVGSQEMLDFVASLYIINDGDTLFFSNSVYIDSASAVELQNWVTKISNNSSNVSISNLTAETTITENLEVSSRTTMTGSTTIDSVLVLTPATKRGLAVPGTIVMDESDSTLYCWDGSEWHALWGEDDVGQVE